MAKAAGADRVGLAMLAAAEVPNFLAGLLPSLMTIQRFGAEDLDRAALRRGLVAGSALSLGVGVAASLIAHDPLPAAMTGVVLLAMVAMYEHAIRNPHPSAKSIDDQ
jgi:hypothetical protein